MNELPGAIFVIDPHLEYISVNEARNLSIPIIAVVDTNCDPDGIDYIIPGNDDSLKAVELYIKKAADAVIEGAKIREANLQKMGSKNKPVEAPEKTAVKAEADSPVVEVQVEKKEEKKEEGKA